MYQILTQNIYGERNLISPFISFPRSLALFPPPPLLPFYQRELLRSWCLGLESPSIYVLLLSVNE